VLSACGSGLLISYQLSPGSTTDSSVAVARQVHRCSATALFIFIYVTPAACVHYTSILRGLSGAPFLARNETCAGGNGGSLWKQANTSCSVPVNPVRGASLVGCGR